MFADGEAPSLPSDENLQTLREKFVTIVIPDLPAACQSFDGTGPRLIITKIVNENFKSYGARRELGPFTKNFNCVVGPNGSGKSNVIDSMLFVFGYRSTKIRSKKLSTLIHRSRLLPNLPFCRVEVHFQKVIDTGEHVKDFTVVPQSDFVISRTAHTDNASYYQINDKRATYKEVAQLLTENGIDLHHNRFLILQGEVEQIAMMQPKAVGPHDEGLLEYLEDIIGSARFKEPIVELEKRIECLNEIKQERINRLKVVEREKNELEGIRNEALDYLRVCNRLVLVKNVLYQKKYFHALQEENAVKQLKLNAEEGLHELKVTKKELDEKLESATEEFNQLESESHRLNKEYTENKTLFTESEAEDSRLRDSFKHTKTDLQKLQSLVSQLDKKIVELEKVPEESTASLEAVENQLLCLEKEKTKKLEAYNKAMENLKQAIDPLVEQRAEKEQELNQLQASVNEDRRCWELARSKLDIFCSNYNKAKERFDGIQAQVVELEKSLQDKEQQLTKIQQDLPRQSTALEKVERDLDVSRKREAELANEVKQKSMRVQEMRLNLEQRTSKGRVLDSLLEQKRLGRIPGVVGRLGDLASIDAKYDVAISTACGALDDIVTDTMDTAQQCVQFLKDHDLGVATFIALDKMNDRWSGPMSRPVKPPNGAVRLFDLIQCQEEKYRPAFYYGVRDTLVAKDLTEGSALAYGATRFRVVTLDGKLIEISGAMTGGGNRVLRGRMGNQSNKEVEEMIDPAEVEKLEKCVQEKSCEMQKVVENRGKWEDAFSSLKNQIHKMTSDQAILTNSIKQLKVESKRLVEDKSRAEQRLLAANPDENERKKLEDQVQECEQQFNASSKRAASKKETVDKISNQINKEREHLSGSAKTSLQKVESSLKEMMDKKTKIAVGIKTAERNLTKAKEQKANKEEQLQSTKEQLKSLTDELTVLAEKASDYLGKYQAAQKERDTTRAKAVEKSKQLEAMNAEFQELNRRVAEVRHKINEAQAKVDEKSREVRHWKANFVALKLTRIKEDEESAELSAALGTEDTTTIASEPLPSSQPVEVAEDVQCTPRDSTGSTAMETEKPDEDQHCPNKQGGQQEEEENDDNDSALIQKVKKLSLCEFLDTQTPCSVSRQYTPKRYKEDELAGVQVSNKDVEDVEKRIEAMNPNMAAIEEFRIKEQLYMRRVSEMQEIDELRDSQLQQHQQFKGQRLNEFMVGFHIITEKLKEMYQMITLGGDAELELVDSLDPFSEGVVFSVRPPNKSWKAISNLSGGEKTLSSLALVFALHHYKPTPLYVMDEIDAALDFKNVSIVANYIKGRTKNAQFIIISLRSNMFELGDRLVGIYKTYDCSFTCTLDPNHMAEPTLQNAIAMVTNVGGGGASRGGGPLPVLSATNMRNATFGGHWLPTQTTMPVATQSGRRMSAEKEAIENIPPSPLSSSSSATAALLLRTNAIQSTPRPTDFSSNPNPHANSAFSLNVMGEDEGDEAAAVQQHQSPLTAASGDHESIISGSVQRNNMSDDLFSPSGILYDDIE